MLTCPEPGPWCEGVRVWWVPDERTGFLVCPRPPPLCRFFDLPGLALEGPQPRGQGLGQHQVEAGAGAGSQALRLLEQGRG